MDYDTGVFDTLADSIQCLNFAKKWFIQYSIQYCFSQDSIQNIFQLKKSADSIQKKTTTLTRSGKPEMLWPRFNSKYYSIKKICWFNSKDNSIQ